MSKINDCKILDSLERQLQNVFIEGKESFIEDNGIPLNLNTEKINQAVDALTKEYAQVEMHDFKYLYPDISEDALEETVRDYCSEYYDDAYVRSLMIRQVDIDDTVEEARLDVIARFKSTEPCSALEYGFWHDVVYFASAKDVFELSESFTDHVDDFTCKYAGDWRKLLDNDLWAET